MELTIKMFWVKNVMSLKALALCFDWQPRKDIWIVAIAVTEVAH